MKDVEEPVNGHTGAGYRWNVATRPTLKGECSSPFYSGLLALRPALSGSLPFRLLPLYRVVVLQGKERIVMNMSSQDWLEVIQKEYAQSYLRQGQGIDETLQPDQP